jgi:ABC-2 type transport system ATP-binding protein
MPLRDADDPVDQQREDHRRTDATTPAAVDVDGLELVYGDGTTAVDGVELRVPEGEFFGFLGPNGAGKTTTINVLATLLSPTGGTVRVNGSAVTTDSRSVRETIGYMAQETSIDPELTAEENIRFACEAYGVPRGERDERVDELLELVDLVDVADKRAEEFSGWTVTFVELLGTWVSAKLGQREQERASQKASLERDAAAAEGSGTRELAQSRR